MGCAEWGHVNGRFKTVPSVTVSADFTEAINKTGTVGVRDLYFACSCIDFSLTNGRDLWFSSF